MLVWQSQMSTTTKLEKLLGKKIAKMPTTPLF